MSHLKNNYVFGILDILLSKLEALLIFDPLITLWGHFKTRYFEMLNDARVASACLYVRTCQRVRNSKNIATIRDFHLPSSFFCLSTRLSPCQNNTLYNDTLETCRQHLTLRCDTSVATDIGFDNSRPFWFENKGPYRVANIWRVRQTLKAEKATWLQIRISYSI